MSMFSRPKCPLCGEKVHKSYKMSELRLETADGMLELSVCPKCAYIMDKSADLLAKKPPGIRQTVDVEDEFDQS